MTESPFQLLTHTLGVAQRALLALLAPALALFVSLSAVASIKARQVQAHPPTLWIVAGLAAALVAVTLLRAALTGDFLIIYKQMRQRALGTWLTLLSVLLGVALAVAVLLVRRESGQLFGQTDFGYEMIVGPPKGADVSLVLSSVYQIGESKGNVPYKIYQGMVEKNGQYRPLVRQAIPIMVGDSYRGRRIIGTSPQMFGYDDNGKPVTEEGHQPWQYRLNRSFEFASGRAFDPRRFEAVVGSEVAEQLHVCTAQEKDAPDNQGKVSSFQATHGMPAPGQTQDIHKPVWQVVGVLKPTHTASDRCLYVPIVSLYSIEEHSSGLIQQAMIRDGIDPSKVTADEMPGLLKKLGFDPEDVPASVMRKLHALGAGKPAPASQPATAPTPAADERVPQTAAASEAVATTTTAPPTTAPAAPPVPPGGELMKDVPAEEPDAYHLDAQGNIIPDIPPDEWTLSAILVKARGPTQASRLQYDFRVANSDAMVVSPAVTMREFFDTFLAPSTLLLVVLAALVSVVAAVSILVSIYNSVSARQKEIAILRALGATRGRILGLICLEAGFVGLLGGLLGLLAGHAAGAVGSAYFQRTLGEGIRWTLVTRDEVAYLAAVVVIAVVAGLVPALKAYRTPVATNLVAS